MWLCTLKMQVRIRSHTYPISTRKTQFPRSCVFSNHLIIKNEKDRYVFLPNSIMNYRWNTFFKTVNELIKCCLKVKTHLVISNTSTILYTLNLASNFSKQIILNEIRKSNSLSLIKIVVTRHLSCIHRDEEYLDLKKFNIT